MRRAGWQHTGVAGLAAAALTLSACSEGGTDADPIDPDGGSEQPVDTDPEPEPEPEPEPAAAGTSVDEIPDDPQLIDEDYVQRVLDALDVLYGEVYATISTSEEVDEEVVLVASLAFTAELAAERAVTFVEEIPDAVDGSGAPTTTLISLQEAGPGCISATVERDVTGVFEGPGGPDVWNVALVPSPSVEESGVAWVYRADFLAPEDDDETGFDGCGEGA